MGTAGGFKDAEFCEGGESVSKSQLDEMCSEQMQKQSGTFSFSVVVSMPLSLTALNVFSHTSSYSGEEVVSPLYR